jgi:hypothetical protein
MKIFVHLGGGGTFTTHFDKVAAIGVSELLLLLFVEFESDSFWFLRKWLHFTHFFDPRVFVTHFLKNKTFAHRTSRSTRVDVSPFAYCRVATSSLSESILQDTNVAASQPPSSSSLGLGGT